MPFRLFVLQFGCCLISSSSNQPSDWLGRLDFCTNQVIGSKDHLQNHHLSVEQDVKPYSIVYLSAVIVIAVINCAEGRARVVHSICLF